MTFPPSLQLTTSSATTSASAAGADALRAAETLLFGSSVDKAALGMGVPSTRADTLATTDASGFALRPNINQPNVVQALSGALGEKLDAAQERLSTLRLPGLNIGPAIDNVLQGVRKGSLLLPDPKREVDDPNTVVQIVGIAAGAIAEGYVAETQIVRGLAYVSRTQKGTKLGKAAERALDMLGQSPTATTAHKLAGGAALSGTAELGLRVASGNTDDLLTSVGIVAVPGAALGGAVASVRALKPVVAKAMDSLAPALRGKLAQAIPTSSKPTLFEDVRRKFDEFRTAASRSFRFEADMQKFAGFEPQLTLGDEIRVLNHHITKAATRARDELATVLQPLTQFDANSFANAYDDFAHIVILRDLQETAPRGLATPLDLPDIAAALAELEARAVPEVIEAANRHRTLVNEMRDMLVSRGKLPAGGGYDNYYPHAHIVQSLADEGFKATGAARKELPSLVSLKKRGLIARGGSARALAGDYIDVMFAAIKRFHVNNQVDDFIEEVAKVHGVERSSLPSDVLKDLDSGFGRAAFGGKILTVYEPRPSNLFRTHVIDDAARLMVEGAAAGGGTLPPAAVVDLANHIKPGLAAGRGRQIILPEEITARLEKFRERDPFYMRSGPFALFRRATAEWKRNTIYWGLSRFFVFQILGDSFNAMRSFGPGLWVRFRNGRIDSPFLKAVNAIYARYNTPLIKSKEQLVATLAGGVGGELASQTFSDDDLSFTQRAAWILAGSGIGYVTGTRKVAGSRPGNPLLAQLYAEADEAAAINTGFVFSEEDLATRITGGAADALKSVGRTTVQRTWDSVKTLITGKVHGNPLNVLKERSIAETIEVVQRERENVLRLAAYIQQIDDGVAPKVAAKRASTALVDYGRFTDVENKFLRGGLLPFYSFYRTNVPNWFKAAIGRDVGGRGKLAFTALAGIAAFDIAAQAWNSSFFPEVEANIPPALRQQFHIILGNPLTKEPLLNKKGEPVVVGFEMPYEQALELLGLARPGVLLADILGVPMRHDDSLMQRAFVLDELKSLPAPVKSVFRGVGDQFLQLLNPFIKLPIELTGNLDWFYLSPIVPERYRGTPEQYREVLKHIARTTLRQYREFPRVVAEGRKREFDLLTSTFGLGLPARGVDIDRQIQVYLHAQMREAAQQTKQQEAPWVRKVDDLLRSRTDLTQPEPNEWDKLVAISIEAGDPLIQQRVYQYYGDAISKADLYKHFTSLSAVERYRFWESLSEADKGAFFFFAGGGSDLVGTGGEIPNPLPRIGPPPTIF